MSTEEAMCQFIGDELKRLPKEFRTDENYIKAGFKFLCLEIDNIKKDALERMNEK